jgi:hypothetical protein
MNWDEYNLARLLMSEERVGREMRQHDREMLAQEEEGKAALRARGLVR